jgi:hypothetical protein
MQVEVHVESDPTRVLKPTQSALAEATPSVRVFADMHGFSTEKVTADRRFRAISMLQAQGMLNKPYAQTVLQDMHLACLAAQRPDCLTTEQRWSQIPRPSNAV